MTTRWRYVLGAAGIAGLQFAAYMAVSSYAFALGDSGGRAPATVDVLYSILGAPLMYLLYLGPQAFGNRWWGDDANFIVGLAILNGILWGAVIMSVVAWWSRRRKHAA